MRIDDKIRHCNRVAVERGSITVFIVVLIPVLLTLIIIVANIGQLIFERIRLQTTVDACALAAATVQAVGLNEIADLNHEAYVEYRKVKSILASGIWYSRSEARKVVRFYSRVFKALTKYRREANRRFARQAWDQALQVQAQNLPKATLRRVSGGSWSQLMQFREELKEVQYLYFSASCRLCPPVSARHWYDPDIPEFYGHHDGSYTLPRKRTIPLLENHVYAVRWRKITPPVTYAALELRQQSKGFLLGNRLLDMTSPLKWRAVPREYQPYIKSLRVRMRMPEMVAYAAAKPTGGDTFKMNPSYQPILTLLRGLVPQPQVSSIDRMEH